MSKSLLLIGPGRYFGTEIIKIFKDAGYKIALLVSSEYSAKKFKSHAYRVTDLTKPEDLRQAIRELIEELGSLSCVIYNAKNSPKGSMLEISQEEFENTLSVNVGAALTVIQETCHSIQDGSFIFTGGGYKDTPDPEKVALSVGKSALNSLYMNSKPIFEKHGVHTSTVIIDGVVRENSAITPKRVAEAFLSMAENKGNKEVRIS